MFNAVRYIKSLESFGLSRELAEAHVDLVINAIEDGVATKSDISEVKTEMEKQLAQFRLEMSQLENRLLLKLTGILLAGMSLQTGILGFLLTARLK
jgi:hypothetical protein